MQRTNGTHVVQHDANKHVEGDPEEVDDSRTGLLGQVLASELHHAGPEDAHTCLKHAKRHQLQLPLKRDACDTNTALVCW